jgi:hypothetical protein
MFLDVDGEAHQTGAGSLVGRGESVGPRAHVLLIPPFDLMKGG